MSLSPGLDSAFRATTVRLDEIRNELVVADVGVLGIPISIRDSLKRHHASCYIWLAATIEQCIPKVIDGLLHEIQLSGVECLKLRPSLWSILGGSELASLQDIRGLKMWTKRVELLERMTTTRPVLFDYEHKPLDGRTVRPRHFEVLWAVFSLPGNPLPSLIHKTALSEIAEIRNRLAHGEVSPLTIGRLKTRDEILRRVDQTEEILEHLILSAQDYLDKNQYIATT